MVPRKILLIDDNPEIHMMMRIILRQNGFQMVSAYNGEDGLEKILEENPDLIILDYMMPKVSGKQVFETFISEERFKDFWHIPVLMLTARKEDKTQKQKLLQKGLYGYLTKPFGMRELVEIIESSLEKAQEFHHQMDLYKVTKEAKDFLEKLVASIPDAIFIIDQQYKVTYFKGCHSNILKYDGVDILNKDFRKIIFSEGNRPFDPAFWESGVENLRKEAFLVNSEGKKIPVYITVTRMKNQNNERIGSLIVATDISDLEKLQQELIKREKLAVFMETAIAVNHEINNPLAPILGNTQILLRDQDKLDKVSVKRLKTIERNAQRIYEITQRLREIKEPVSTDYVGETRMLDLKEPAK